MKLKSLVGPELLIGASAPKKWVKAKPMKPILPALIVAGTLAFASGAQAQKSALRIVCEGDDVGAEVSVNGKFRGECPLDIGVAPGTIKLRVEKKGDALRERVFEQEIRMGEGTAKKVEVRLATRLTAEGQRQEAARLKADADLVLLREEDAQWKRAQDTATRASIQGYLEKYPTGRYLAEARQKYEEYRLIPPRPQMPFAVSEDIWKIIEASEAYRSLPQPRAIKINYQFSEQREYTGSKTVSLPKPAATTVVTTKEAVPLGEKCSAIRNATTRDGQRDSDTRSYGCGFLSLGYTSNDKHTGLIKSIDELKGSLFPMQIGNQLAVRLQFASLTDRKYDSTYARSCQVMSQSQARELDPRLAGTAWKIHCQTSNTIGARAFTSENDDYFLEDYGATLSAIGVFDAPNKKFIIPSPGSQTVLLVEGEYGSRITRTYANYDWTVGK